MNCGRSAGALWRSQFAGSRGRRGHEARPFTQRTHVVEQSMMRRVLTLPAMSAGITLSSASTASPNDAFSESRHVLSGPAKGA